MNALEIRGLRKSYGGAEVLKGVDLTIGQGEFFGLLGHNGAGKTTTLGIVSGLIRKTSGTVSVFGHSIDDAPLKARACIGLASQDCTFSQFETVEEVVLCQAGFYGIPRSRARQEAEGIFRRLDLDRFRRQETRELSGGAKRRLMLARAVIVRPRLLILDEPTAGTDAAARRSMWDYLRELNASGVTVLLTTHYFEEIEQLCGRAAILENGCIADLGTVPELSSRLGEKRLILELEGPLIPGLPLRPSPLGANFAECTYDPSSGSLTDLIVRLQSQGCTVRSVRSAASSLEEYFLRRTGDRPL